MKRFIKKITGTKFKIIITALGALMGPVVAYAVVQSLNGQTGQTQSFTNDANVVITSANDIHALGWAGQLPVSRGGTGNDAFAEGSVIFMGQNRFRQDNSSSGIGLIIGWALALFCPLLRLMWRATLQSPAILR